MKKWQRDGYTVEETAFDGDLHVFEVIKDNEVVATITPDNINVMNVIIEDLNAGEDVNGWDDGMGNTIKV